MWKKEMLEEMIHDLKELKEDVEALKVGTNERTQYLQDVVEGFGRQQQPGTKLCPQCYGAGGKWEERENGHLGIRASLFFMAGCDWWTCDTCKGTGRMRKESLLNVSADVPAKKKKG